MYRGKNKIFRQIAYTDWVPCLNSIMCRYYANAVLRLLFSPASARILQLSKSQLFHHNLCTNEKFKVKTHYLNLTWDLIVRRGMCLPNFMFSSGKPLFIAIATKFPWGFFPLFNHSRSPLLSTVRKETWNFVLLLFLCL